MNRKQTTHTASEARPWLRPEEKFGLPARPAGRVTAWPSPSQGESSPVKPRALGAPRTQSGLNFHHVLEQSLIPIGPRGSTALPVMNCTQYRLIPVNTA